MILTLTKVHEIRGDETPCFDAVLCVDNVPRLYVRNSGTGGPCQYDSYEPGARSPYVTGSVRELEQLAEQLLRSEGEEHPDFEPLDTLVYRLLDMHAERKQLRSLLTRGAKAGKTYFRKPGDPADTWTHIKGGADEAARRAHIATKYPDAVLLADYLAHGVAIVTNVSSKVGKAVA